MEIDKKVKKTYSIKKVSSDELAALLTMLEPWRVYVKKLPSIADVDTQQLEMYNDLHYAYYGSRAVWGQSNVG